MGLTHLSPCIQRWARFSLLLTWRHGGKAQQASFVVLRVGDMWAAGHGRALLVHHFMRNTFGCEQFMLVRSCDISWYVCEAYCFLLLAGTSRYEGGVKFDRMQ